MKGFVARQNIEHYRELLKTTTDSAERRSIGKDRCDLNCRQSRRPVFSMPAHLAGSRVLIPAFQSCRDIWYVLHTQPPISRPIDSCSCYVLNIP